MMRTGNSPGSWAPPRHHERKRTETALLHSEMQNRALLSAVPDLLFQIHRDGTFLQCTAQARPCTRRSNSSWEQDPEGAPADIAALMMKRIEKTLESGAMQVFEYQLPSPGTGDYEPAWSPAALTR